MREADGYDDDRSVLGAEVVGWGERMKSAPLGVGHSLPAHIEAMIVQDMVDLGVDPAFVYAFQHTGLLVTDATIDGYTDAELALWQATLDRYRRLRSTAG